MPTVASVSTNPAPPTARLPRCTKCQSFAYPSALDYWHIGETNTRFANLVSRIARGSNKCVIGSTLSFLRLEEPPRGCDRPSCRTSPEPVTSGAVIHGLELHWAGRRRRYL